MDWAGEIIREIEGKKPIPPDVLDLIRPSLGMLELGVSPDGLYRYCRNNVRSMLRELHPDVNRGKVLPALQRVSHAFDAIKDRRVFDDALLVAREERVYQSREQQTLRVMAQNAERKSRFLEEELKRAEERTEAATVVNDWMRRYLAGQAMPLSPSTRMLSLAERTHLSVLSLALQFAPEAPRREALPEAEPFYKRILHLIEVFPHRKEEKSLRTHIDEPLGGLCRVINANHLGAKSLADLMKASSHTGGGFPTIRWDFGAALVELGFPAAVRFASQRPYHRSGKDAVVPLKHTDTARTSYQSIMTRLMAEFGRKHVNDAAIIPERIALNHQVVEHDAVSRDSLYILGTVPIDAALFCVQGIGSSRRLVLHDCILPYVEPFVAPERAVVAMQIPKSSFTRSHSTFGKLADVLADRDRYASKGLSLFLSHIILDVE